MPAEMNRIVKNDTTINMYCWYNSDDADARRCSRSSLSTRSTLITLRNPSDTPPELLLIASSMMPGKMVERSTRAVELAMYVPGYLRHNVANWQ